MHHDILLVIDGHDGSGKTTLARGLASALEVPYIRPFHGHAGAAMLAAAESKDFLRAEEIALEQVDSALRSHPATVRVVDRHWMTVFSLLPEEFWQKWKPLPPTTLCAADLECTIKRLSHRDETYAGSEWHSLYIARYEQLARQFRVPIVRTDRHAIDEALAALTTWARAVIGVDP